MREIEAKSILSAYNKGDSWFGANYNMNIYKGCCHGCIYCDSRSDCYRIENFDEVRIKKDAINILEKELRTKRKKGIIMSGAMTDHYTPFEIEKKVMRNILMLIDRYRYGISISTKSPLIVRDIDLLSRIKDHSPVNAGITITAADDSLCRKIEPHVAVSSVRFAAIKKLSKAGIFTGIHLMPVLPFLNDTEENIISLIHLAAEANAKYIYVHHNFGVTLRQNQREYFFAKLDENFPGLKARYIKTFGYSYECVSPNNEKLRQVFSDECAKYNILYNMRDIIREAKCGYIRQQATLF